MLDPVVLFVIEWLGSLLVLIGLYKIGNKDITAFIYLICGCVLHSVVALENGLYGWLILTLCIIVLDLRSWYRWESEV